MELKALVVNEKDNVANLIGPGKKGAEVNCQVEEQDKPVKVTLLGDLPSNHKFAFRDIKPEEPIIKYGLQIGIATEAIKQGAHVHAHNIESTRGRGDLGKSETASAEA